MRVLLVSRILAHYRLGVYAHLAELPDQEWVFAAGTTTVEGEIPTLTMSQVPGRFYPLTNRWFGKFVWQAGLFRAIFRVRPDVVVFEGNFANLSTWLAAAICRVAGRRVFYWTTGWHRSETGIKRIARLAFYRLAHRLLMYGKTGIAIGARMGFPRERMTLVRNSYASSLTRASVDVDDLRAFAASLPHGRGPVVGAVIRLNPVKRLDFMLRAASLVRQRGVDVRVLIVGEGPARDTLLKLAEDLHVPLYLPGPAYSDEALAMVYERLQLTVLPEWAGLTVVQSMSHGCPVVTHGDFLEQSSEAEAIVPGVTGSLFERGSVEDASEHIAEWLAITDSRRAEVSAACREEIQRNWTAEAHAQAISAAVRSV